MKYFCRLKLHPISFVCAERAFYGWSSPIFLHKWANCISISKIWGSSRAECAYISNDCREQTKDIHYLAHTAIWCNLQTRIDSLPQPARLECRTEQSEFHSTRLEPIFHVLLKGLINLRSETEQSENSSMQLVVIGQRTIHLCCQCTGGCSCHLYSPLRSESHLETQFMVYGIPVLDFWRRRGLIPCAPANGQLY